MANDDINIEEFKKNLEEFTSEQILDIMTRAAREHQKEKMLKEYNELNEQSRKILENPLITPDNKKRLEEIDKRKAEIVKEMSKPKNMTPQKTTDEKAELQKEIQKLKEKEKELRPTDKEDEYKRVYNQLKEKTKELEKIEKNEKQASRENSISTLVKKMFEMDPGYVKKVMEKPPTKEEILDKMGKTFKERKIGNIN